MKIKQLILALAIIVVSNIANGQSSIASNIEVTTNEMYLESQTASTFNAKPVPDNSGTSDYKMPRFYIGVRLFGTASDIKVNTVENNNVSVAKTSTTLGYGYGGYLGFNFSKNVALNLEAIYSTIAQKYKDNGLDRRIDINYLNIPLMLVLNTNTNKPVNFNIAAGPQVGINTGAKLSSVEQGNSTVINSKFTVKATDFGFAYGAGFDFRIIRALSIGIGYRGVIGLVDISDKNSTASYSSTDSNGVTTTQTVVVLDKSKVRTYGGYVGLRFSF